VEALADRVGVILGGQLRDVGRISELLSARIRSVEVIIDLPEAARAAVSAGKLVSRDQARFGLSFEDLDQANAAVGAAMAAGAELVSMVPHRETLEDFFVRRLDERKAAGQAGRAPETR
jgi:ABC-2 type transport system ATP-binding protein